MTLNDYLKLAGMRGATFAAKIGYSRMSVSRWRRRLAMPGPDAIRAIFSATSGAVGPADWYAVALPPAPPPRARARTREQGRVA